MRFITPPLSPCPDHPAPLAMSCPS